MKYLVLIFASYFLINTTFSQVKTAYQLSDFDELIVIGNFQVEVVQSDRKEALVSKHADEVDLNNLSFSYTKNVLTIKYSGSFVETIAGKEMLIKAIKNTASSPFHIGENERGWKADLDFIIKSYEQVERLSNLDVKPLKVEEYSIDWSKI